MAPQDGEGKVMRASDRFRFRFLVRGEVAARNVPYAVASLLRCHPSADVVVVDANDERDVDLGRLPPGVRLLWIRPEDDEVSACVGRGTRDHVYYWRHSRAVTDRIARELPGRPFDVHVDADMLFLRPMDLGALVPHLEAGRIAMAVDRDTQRFYHLMESRASALSSTAFPFGGARGPMLQGGLLFRNPADDGGLLDHMWATAKAEARRGTLLDLPWVDQTLLSQVLAQGGPLWGRLLALGHEWNCVSVKETDPGPFAYVAHFAGTHDASPFSDGGFARMFPPAIGADPSLCRRHPVIAWRGLPRAEGCELSLDPPFAFTWHVPPGAHVFAGEVRCAGGAARGSGARLAFYRDGSLAGVESVYSRRGPRAVEFSVRDGETLTAIGVGSGSDVRVILAGGTFRGPGIATRFDVGSREAPGIL